MSRNLSLQEKKGVASVAEFLNECIKCKKKKWLPSVIPRYVCDGCQESYEKTQVQGEFDLEGSV